MKESLRNTFLRKSCSAVTEGLCFRTCGLAGGLCFVDNAGL